MRIVASQSVWALLLILPLCNARPAKETNGERFRRGLPPLAPRRLFDATKAASAYEIEQIPLQADCFNLLALWTRY